jgi:TP901 family phage tail tape measure protein
MRNSVTDLGQRMQKVGKDFANVGKKLTTTLTLPIVGIGTMAVRAVAGFDDAMSSVQAISGATADDMTKLRDQAKQLGSTTAHSAKAVANAMEYQALAGWETNQILEATPGLLNLASAGKLDLAKASDIVTDSMSMFGLEASKATSVADMFTATASSSNTNIEQLGEALKYVGATARAAGMDMAQTNSVLGVLADSSLKGSIAGTTMTAMFNDLTSKVKNGAVQIGKTAVAVYDAEGNMRDLASVVFDVGKATEGMTNAQRDAALSNIFGTQAMKGINIMLETGIDRYNELSDAIYGSEGASAKVAEIMEDSLAGSFRALGSAVEGLMLQFDNELKDIVGGLAKSLTNLAQRFSNLTEGQRKTILVVGGVLAAIGPLVFLIGKVITTTETLISWLPKLKAAFLLLTGPVGIAIMAIGGLISIGYMLYKNWDVFRENIVTAAQAIKDGFVNSFTELQNKVLGIWDKITGGIKGAINSILGSINKMIRGMNNIKIDIPNWVPGMGGKSFGINVPEIPMLAKGTNNFQGGMAIVGEEGPELVTMPKASKVTPNHKTEKMLSNSSTVNHFSPNINITIEGNNVDKENIDSMKQELRRQLYPMLEEYFNMMSKKRPSLTL